MRAMEAYLCCRVGAVMLISGKPPKAALLKLVGPQAPPNPQGVS